MQVGLQFSKDEMVCVNNSNTLLSNITTCAVSYSQAVTRHKCAGTEEVSPPFFKRTEK